MTITASLSLVLLPMRIIRSRGYKLILVASAAAYWVLYAFSVNILQYYQSGLDLSAFKGIGTPTIVGWLYFIPARLVGWYYSGVEWYPNGHLEVNFLFGATFFSILLSFLFGLNMVMLGYLLSTRYKGRKAGLTGFLGIVPALFSSGMPCCSAPIGTLVLSAVVPSAALVTSAIDYSPLTNAVTALIMLFSIFYVSRKVARPSCRNPPAVNKP